MQPAAVALDTLCLSLHLQEIFPRAFFCENTDFLNIFFSAGLDAVLLEEQTLAYF